MRHHMAVLRSLYLSEVDVACAQRRHSATRCLVSLLRVLQRASQLCPVLLGGHQRFLLCQLLKTLGKQGTLLFGEGEQHGFKAVPHPAQGWQVLVLAGQIARFDVNTELGKAGLAVHQEQLGVAIEMGFDGMKFMSLE